MRRKILFFAGCLLLLLFIIAAAAAGKAYFFPPPTEIPASTALTPAETIPGEKTKYSFILTLPLGERISGAEVAGDKIIASPPEIEFKSWKFDRAAWQISGSLCKLDFGPTGEMTLKISTVSAMTGSEKSYSVKLPSLPGTAPEKIAAGQPLILAPAPELPPAVPEVPWYKKWWIYLTAAAAAAAAFLWKIHARKKIAAENLPADEKAIREIRRIKSEVLERKLLPERGFAAISDCVRSYLEDRFQLPATRQTTGEFLHTLAGNDNLLSPEEKLFLTGFLNHADIIKFAAGKADESMIIQAAGDAEKMIRTTAGEKEK